MIDGEKKRIAERLAVYCRQMGGQNKAANSLKGVSSATISKVLNNQWDTIADTMWHSISAQIGANAGDWQVVETAAYSDMIDLMASAKEDSQVLAIVGSAGGGKSVAIREYASATAGVHVVSCSEYMNKNAFLREVLRVMGLDNQGMNVAEMVDDVVSRLKRQDRPLLILDEADKLSDQVLYFFITMYNKLEDACGLILCATQYLEKRILKGVRIERKGYAEIFSRIGRQFIHLPEANREDIAAICVANGVTDARVINAIVKESDCDLRRVKRAVWKYHKLSGQEAA
ncbi:AAA family ATPase [Porphyromonas loveana]|uniref:AAA family ATPase n=1 Tax=Porphyromonas loveana TaxID=1884669 RepID=UPI0035A05E4F